MAIIKDIIYKAAKKISNTTELDITPEELAHLALYKVMNLPYFEGANNFLTLHYNVFNEFSLGNLPLNNLKGYTNGNLDSFVIIFDKSDQISSKIDVENQLLKKADYELLENFIKLVNDSKNIQEIAEKITKIEKEDPVFMNKIMTITQTSSYAGNSLIRGINQLVKYNGEGTHSEYMLENQSKVEHYRSSHCSNDLKEVCFNSYSLKKITDKSIAEINSEISGSDISYMTGISNFTKENLENFHLTHPEEYSKSIYRIFRENSDETVRTILTFDLKYFEEELKNLNKKVKSILKNPIAEDILEKYNDSISPIIKAVEKQYPQVTKLLSESPYEIKSFIYNSANDKEDFISKESPLEIYQDDYTSTDYTSVRGNSFYKIFYNSNNGIYIGANNGLEDIAGGEGDFRKDLSASGYLIKIDNVRMYRLYEAGRDVSINIKQDVIEGFVKMAQEKNVPFVYDIVERTHKGESKFNSDVNEAVNHLKEKYPNVIFVNDGMSFDDSARLQRDIKSDLLMTMAENKVSMDKMLIVMKKIESFFTTERFEKLVKLDYFDRKKDTTIEKVKEEALAELTKNKRKVSP